MKWKFWKQKEEEKIQTFKEVTKSVLTVYSSKTEPYVFERKPDHKNKHVDTWKEFYKWYFGRKQSEVFVFTHNTGLVSINREDIIYFKIITIGEFIDVTT